jgi:methylmalonyl-CoA/ethylmalonyl-CoA epimerase
MKHLISINHIGYAVCDINKTAQLYLNAGWSLSTIYEEEVQRTKIAFLTKEGFPTIELVAPLHEDEPSPVDNFLSKIGTTTYHVCYDVDDIEEAVEDLFDEGFKPLFMPVESVAMDNHQICYLYHVDVGLIELVSTK